MLSKIISVCCAKDMRAWKVAAARLPKCIEALKYEVIVPDHEVAIFKAESPAIFSVLPESFYLGKYTLSWLQDRFPPLLSGRAGWYLQQFIKIEAARRAGLNQNCLIWDADTVPIKKIHFEDADGRLLYYKGNYRPPIHEPYFDLIKSVLGIPRLGENSYIAQCFAFRTNWVEDMCSTIEQKFSATSWIEVVVDHIDHSKGGCGFSEYETLGTFFSHKYANEIKFIDRQFFRHGTQLVGNPENIDLAAWAGLAEIVDFVAFEVYETGVYRGLHIGCGNTRIENTLQGNLVLNTDIMECPEIDLLLDVEKALPFPPNQFEHVIALNILEHVNDIMFVMQEIDRCLQVGGIIQIEVPFIGSYNHGTDVTHIRGLTFDSFNFLLDDNRNYLYRNPKTRCFNYQLTAFFRENIVDDILTREYLPAIPPRGSYSDWIEKVNKFQIPGTFGMIWQKLS
jgi:SAM-dependent methyltransferase